MKVEKFGDVLDNLACGNVKIKYNRWSFSGGHTYGDFDDFDIIEDDKKVALLRINMDHNEIEYNPSFYLRNDDYSQDLLAEFNDEDYDDVCNDIYNKYLVRDDKEFCDKIRNNDGELYFPRDYDDISREDVISGRWSPDFVVRTQAVLAHKFDQQSSADVVSKAVSQGEQIGNSQKEAGADYVFWQG